jgi:hypothetical protein
MAFHWYHFRKMGVVGRITDSGASEHMTGDESLLFHIKALDSMSCLLHTPQNSARSVEDEACCPHETAQGRSRIIRSRAPLRANDHAAQPITRSFDRSGRMREYSFRGV